MRNSVFDNLFSSRDLLGPLSEIVVDYIFVRMYIFEAMYIFSGED